MGFELSPEYKDVPARIADFKAKYPDGRLRPVNPEEPYKIEAIDGRFFIVYTAAAYTGPDDTLPGIGVAWEPFPGKTPYTKDSELQNAETSAWGRAIVAALASESKRIASAEDVRNRQADAQVQPVTRFTAPTGEIIDIWPGELDMKAAKGQVLTALSGDKTAAEVAWAEAGFDGRWKVTENELAPVLAKIGAGASREESPSAAGASAGSSPATAAPAPNEDARNDAMHAANAAYVAESEQRVVDARAVGIRSQKVFDAVVERYPDRKKAWTQDHLRHALAYVVSGGKAARTNLLEPAQLAVVWNLLDDIEARRASFTFSADPAHGCEFTWADGTTTAVMWSELTLAEAGAA